MVGVRARSSVVEQPAHNRLVAGSIPAGPTTSGVRAKYWRILGRIRSKGTGQFLLLFVGFHSIVSSCPASCQC